MGKTKIVTSCAHIIIQKTIRNQNQKQNKNKAGYCGSAYSLSQSKQWKSGRGEKKLALCFDEAHYLLNKGEYVTANETVTMKAMQFRIVRLWICKQRKDLQIVAVFTGTTAKLINFIISDDLDHDHYRKTDTRLRRSKKGGFYTFRGQRPNEPFSTTTTIGCLRFEERGSSEGQQSDCSIAVPRGRPLFAVMSDQELKDGEPKNHSTHCSRISK